MKRPRSRLLLLGTVLIVTGCAGPSADNAVHTPRSTLLFDAVPPRYATTSRIPSARQPTAASLVDEGRSYAYRQMTFDRYGDNRSQRSGYQRTTISVVEARGRR